MISPATILVVQLVMPLVLAAPIWLWADIPTKRRERSGGRSGGSANVGKRIEPLECPKCSAPVPLHSEPFPCPSCSATVTPPIEYANMVELRAAAIAELARAERRWRWSRWTSSPIVGLLLFLLSLGYFVLDVYAVIEIDWSFAIGVVALMTSGFLSVAGMVSAFALVGAREKLPPLPPRSFMHPPAAQGTCRHCNAPVAFAVDELAAICPYCGGDNYRESVAHAAQTEASMRAQAATRSLVDAVAELDERRTTLFAIIACSALVELLYGLVVGIGMISDWLGL